MSARETGVGFVGVVLMHCHSEGIVSVHRGYALAALGVCAGGLCCSTYVGVGVVVGRCMGVTDRIHVTAVCQERVL